MRTRRTPLFTVDPAGCWVWSARIDRHGYGVWSVNGRTLGAHRVMYERFHGPVPAGLEIDHLCRVRHCVNPTHMEAVTHSENLRRIPNDIRGRQPRKTHCANGHPFTEENTILRNRGDRECRTCRNAYARAWKAQRKALRAPS